MPQDDKARKNPGQFPSTADSPVRDPLRRRKPDQEKDPHPYSFGAPESRRNKPEDDVKSQDQGFDRHSGTPPLRGGKDAENQVRFQESTAPADETPAGRNEEPLALLVVERTNPRCQRVCSGLIDL